MNMLILGGVRSGKSSFAELLANRYSHVTYLATAVAVDDETKSRIERHRQDRPAHWHTIEAPVHLADSLTKVASNSTILIDCLSFWVNNCLYDSEQTWIKQRDIFFETFTGITNPVIMVSNEISLGVIPMGAETRLFVDELGRLHQWLARQVDTVLLMVAGIPQIIKGELLK